MSASHNRKPPFSSPSSSLVGTDFNVNAGRDAFKNVTLNSEMDKDELRRQQFAMRSFTESIEMDCPPVPILPSTLDIEQYKFENNDKNLLTSSSTADTIVDLQKQLDPTLGETQKYPMTVPEPGHTDQEIELHKSLMLHENDEIEDLNNLSNIPAKIERKKFYDKDHEALKKEISNAAKQRPRPTTPTSMCTLESYVSETEKLIKQQQQQNSEKIAIKIPRKSMKNKQPEDFYQSMTSQMPLQLRESLRKSFENLGPDADIIEGIPEFKEKAPKAPVVHRRISIEWEAFEDSGDKMEKPEEPIQKSITPINSPTHSPTLEEMYGEEDSQTTIHSLADGRIENNKKNETAEAFAEELFGGQSDEWEAPPKDITPIYDNVWQASDEPPSFGDPFEHLDDIPTNVEPGAELTETPLVEKVEEKILPTQTSVEITADSTLVQPAENSEVQQDYENYDYHNYDATTYNYDQTAAGYGYDENGQPYDYSQYGYDQTGAYNYDPTAYPTDPNSADYAAYYGQTTTTAGAGATTDGQDYSAYGTGTYDYSATDQTAENYDYSAYGTATTADNYYGTAAAYGTETNGTVGYDQTYGTTTAVTDPHGYDYSQYGGNYSYGDHGQAVDYSQYGYPATNPTETTAEEAADRPWDVEELTEFGSSLPVVQPLPVESSPEPESLETKEAEEQVKQAPPRPEKSPEPATAPPRPEKSPEPAFAPPRPPAPPIPQPSRPPPPIISSTSPMKPPPPLPPPPMEKQPPQKQPTEEDEDPWAKFKKMTEQVSNAVKTTEEKIKELSENTTANDIKDESYLSTIGGNQMSITPEIQRKMQMIEEEQKKIKADKKKAKKLQKKPSKEFTEAEEKDLDKAAAELAAKLSARCNFEGFGEVKPVISSAKTKSVVSPSQHESALKSPEEKVTSVEVEENGTKNEESVKSPEMEEPPVKAAIPDNWAAFGESVEFNPPTLPASDSDFFTTHLQAVPPAMTDDPFAPPKSIDPFAPINKEQGFDPFDIRPAEDIVAKAKERAKLIASRQDDSDIDYLQHPSSAYSSPTPEGGSPISSRPIGFDDEFRPGTVQTPTPLYDEDDSQPLVEFPKKFTGEGWELMIRYPPKKKIMGDRYWKPCFVRIKENMLYIFDSKTESRPFQEIMLQPTYSLSDSTLQAYDVYGKIHTVKLQCVQYKERIGIRAGQISRLVEGHITKYGMPIEHAAQVTVLAKFGCLNGEILNTFINIIEDYLFVTPIKREISPIYKQDEVQIHCYDEYQAHVDKDGIVTNQLARVRMFCLAFVSGNPILEIGLNDRRRQGKEIVRRKDILPMYTERWIRFENLNFHSTVDKNAFDDEQVIKLSPPDGIFIEICRFRIRPPKNREKPLTVKSIMRIAGSKIEIRIDCMAAAQQQRAKGTTESTRTIPCEDICIRFPIPEAWIYIFREERHWGVGSVHSKSRKPGKVKNLKDRLMGAVQHQEQSLIEVAIGEAKYEHVYRSLVWRIPRLPEKTANAYKDYLLKCRFDLSSFDLMPETFLPTCDVEFTMPLATISNTVVRSVSVEQHEDSDRVEKFVRYVAKCKYDVEVDYVQCNDLDNDAIFDMHVANPEAVMNVQPEQHKPLFDPNEVAKQHTGYGIEFSASEVGATPRIRNDSSSDEEETKRNVPMIEIDMRGYGY